MRPQYFSANPASSTSSSSFPTGYQEKEWNETNDFYKGMNSFLPAPCSIAKYVVKRFWH